MYLYVNMCMYDTILVFLLQLSATLKLVGDHLKPVSQVRQLTN